MPTLQQLLDAAPDPFAKTDSATATLDAPSDSPPASETAPSTDSDSDLNELLRQAPNAFDLPLAPERTEPTVTGEFVRGAVEPFKALAKSPKLLHEDNDDELYTEIVKEHARQRSMGPGNWKTKAGGLVGGVVGGVAEFAGATAAAGPTGVAAPFVGPAVAFGASGSWESAMNAGVRALNEGKPKSEVIRIAKEMAGVGAATGAGTALALGATGLIPRTASALARTVGTAAIGAGAGAGGQLVENVAMAQAGLEVSPTEGLLEQAAIMGLLPVVAHAKDLYRQARVASTTNPATSKALEKEATDLLKEATKRAKETPATEGATLETPGIEKAAATPKAEPVSTQADLDKTAANAATAVPQAEEIADSQTPIADKGPEPPPAESGVSTPGPTPKASSGGSGEAGRAIGGRESKVPESIVESPKSEAEPVGKTTLGVWPEAEWSYAHLKGLTLGQRADRARFLGLRTKEGNVEVSAKRIADRAKVRLAELAAERSRKPRVESRDESVTAPVTGENNPLGTTEKGQIPRADQLLGATPEQFADWKKRIEYGQDDPARLASHMTDAEMEQFKGQRDELRAQAADILKGAKPEDDATISRANVISLKAQILNEIIEAYPKLELADIKVGGRQAGLWISNHLPEYDLDVDSFLLTRSGKLLKAQLPPEGSKVTLSPTNYQQTKEGKIVPYALELRVGNKGLVNTLVGSAKPDEIHHAVLKLMQFATDQRWEVGLSDRTDGEEAEARGEKSGSTLPKEVEQAVVDFYKQQEPKPPEVKEPAEYEKGKTTASTQATLLEAEKQRAPELQRLRRLVDELQAKYDGDEGMNDADIERLTKLKARLAEVEKDAYGQAAGLDSKGRTPERQKLLDDMAKATREATSQQGAMAKPPAPAPENEVTPSEQKKGFDARQAKQQKKFLLGEIDKAIEEAPETVRGAWQNPELKAENEAAQDALAAIPVVGEYAGTTTEERQAERKAKTEQWESEHGPKMEPLLQKYGIAKESPSSTPYKDLTGVERQDRKSKPYTLTDRISLLQKAINEANAKAAPRITIEVPGDGVFEIVNDKQALTEFREKAERFPTTAPREKKPGASRATPTNAAPLGKMEADAIRKAVAASVGTDATRKVLENLYSDGKVTVSTDGRRLTIIKKGIGGTEQTPIMETPSGKQIEQGKDQPPSKPITTWKVSYTDLETRAAKRPFYKLTENVAARTREEAIERLKSHFPEPRYGEFRASKAEGAKANQMFGTPEEEPNLKYPNWKQVIPAEADLKNSIKDLDAARLFTVVKQAMEVTSEKSLSIKLWRNQDGSIGVSAATPEIGEYAHNVQEKAQTIVAIDPQYVVDALNAARLVGDEKITLKWIDETSPVVIESKGTKSVIMPMRLEGGMPRPTISERPTEAKADRTMQDVWREQYARQLDKIITAGTSGISSAQEAINTARMLELPKTQIAKDLAERGMTKENIDYALKNYKFAAPTGGGHTIEGARAEAEQAFGKLNERVSFVHEPDNPSAAYTDRNRIVVNAAQVAPGTVKQVLLEEGLHGVWHEPSVQEAWSAFRRGVTEYDLAAERAKRKGLDTSRETLKEEAAISKLLSNPEAPLAKRVWDAIIAALDKLFGVKVGDDRATLIEAAREFLQRERSEGRSQKSEEVTSKRFAVPTIPPAGPVPPAVSQVRRVMDKAGESLHRARETAAHLWTSGKVREAIAYLKDAAGNKANLFGRQMSNEIRQPLTRQFKGYEKRAAEALSFVIEAKGDRDQLDVFRNQILTSTSASDYWKKRAVDALDLAIYKWDELRPLAEQYKIITDEQVRRENAGGVDTLTREGYVMHEQDIDETPSVGSSGSGTGSGFRKVRTHDTFADSIAAGVDPKSINAVDLLQSRVSRGERLLNNRAWVEGLRTTVDPRTHAPVATDPTIVRRADGTTYPEAPTGYVLEFLNRQPVAIQRGYEGLIEAVTDPSKFANSLGGQSLMKGAGAGKSIALLFDTFHLGRVAFWDSLIKGMGISTFKLPFPTYRRGLTLADFTDAQLTDMAARGEIPGHWLANLTQERTRLDHLVAGGYNIGRISDALYQDWIHNLPGLGRFNKWLFDSFQRGAMVETGLLEFERLKAARPGMSDVEVGRQVAKDLNTRFGSLGRQGIFKSRTFQDLARLLILAPQWNEGLIRSELGAVKQLGEFARDTAQGKRLYAGVLLRSVGGMALAQFAANQLINLITRGKPTWENEEEGLGAKLSAWIPDKIGGGSGFFLHPLGLAAETTHLLMSKFEKTGDFHKSLRDYGRSRSSTVMRPVLTFITNEDFLGRRLKPGTVWGEMAKDAIPRPIGGASLVQGAKQALTGKESESFAGQFQKQVLSSFGIKTEGAPSPPTRISALAREFNRAKGITPSAEFFSGDYQPVSAALAIGNESDAREALKELLKKKTAEQVRTYFSRWPNHPFTGQRGRETQFRATLTPEQKDQYSKAVAQRRKIAQRVMQLLRGAQME